MFGGPEDRRLPRTATELWTVDLDDVGEHWVEVIGRQLVLVAAERPTADTSITLVALDARHGRPTVDAAAGGPHRAR